VELEELATPSLVVGFRDEWLNIPPTAIRLWEKALLEPYAPRYVDVGGWPRARRSASSQVD
jgi:hypothetical protein